MNPSVDDPRDFLGFRDYAYKEKHPIGKETYEACGLNDTEKHCVPRFRVCKEMKDKVEGFIQRVRNITPTSRTQVKNRLRNDVKELLEDCQNDKAYTAIKATMMVNNPDYATLVNEMKACGLWVQILEDLDVEMRTYVMDLI